MGIEFIESNPAETENFVRWHINMCFVTGLEASVETKQPLKDI
jgi:hypothetical protein